ncbi:MAG: type I methionyl aminopeptidase [Bacteroidota bacterium]
MSINSKSELEGIKKVNQVVGITLKKMRAYTRVGMSTKELDEYGNTILKKYGATSAPLRDYNFPGYTCISLNHEACHGIPSRNRIIKEGDLLNIDVSAELNGFYGDNGGSFIVGRDIQNLQPLVTASQEILNLAINKLKHNVRIYEIGGFIKKEANIRGFKVIKNLCGHGIGRKLHEYPSEIPNFKDRLNRVKLKDKMVIALETFISNNSNYVYETGDGWTMKARNNGFVAQHEHTVLITKEKPIVLTKINGI